MTFQNEYPMMHFTRYEYAVRTTNPAGSTDSEWRAVETAPAAPDGLSPPVVEHVPGMYDRLRVTWQPPLSPNGVITSYQVS